MKNQWKNIILILIALVIGLGAGYILFGSKSADASDHTLVTKTDLGESTGEEQIWTCSMHPQIRQDESGQCPICGMDLIPVGSTTSGDNPLVMEMTPSAVKLARIQTIEVGNNGSSSVKSISLTGRILPDERLTASQVSHVAGRIEQLFVSFTGETVQKGQRIATIYSPELVSAQKELIEAAQWKETRPQLLEASRNKLRYWKISDAMIDEILNSGSVQQNITLYADKGGVVLKRRVAVGDYIKEGTVLFDIANLSRLWVLFDAYEDDLKNVQVGDRVDYTVSSLSGRTFNTRISFIDPVINPQTRVASLRAEVSNTHNLLKPDMFVRGTIKARRHLGSGTFVVPKTAVMWTGPRSVVYVEVPDNTVPSYEFREVEVMETVGSDYLIKDGLSEGDRVVVNGAFVIDAAAQLNNGASMMNRMVRQRGEALTIPDFTVSTPEVFRDQLGQTVQSYLKLKDAFVDTNGDEARTDATEFLNNIGDVQMELLEGEAHMFWMEKMNILKGHAENIIETNDVEIQRKQFKFISDALVQTITAFGTEDTIYLQYCPMAFDDEGADWLSRDEEIRNPYFGEKMLKCGSIKETITRDFRNPSMEQPGIAHPQGHIH